MSQYTLKDFVDDGHECPTCGDTFDTGVALKAHHQHHDKPYFDAIVEQEYGASPAEFLREEHHTNLKTLQEVGDLIGASVTAIQTMADRHGVDTRDLSEAKEVEWEQLDEDGRSERLDAPHERTRELVEDGEHNFVGWADDATEEERKQRTEAAREAHFSEYGDSGHIAEWVRKNPEKHRELAKKFAGLGTPAREKNGMEGVTGQDHPNWRGGKSIYDAVKKQLKPSFDSVKDDYREDGCYNCGPSGCKLDVHHIVPLMAGGTNEEWNAMTLCESCHIKAEWYTRDIIEPVLVE